MNTAQEFSTKSRKQNKSTSAWSVIHLSMLISLSHCGDCSSHYYYVPALECSTDTQCPQWYSCQSGYCVCDHNQCNEYAMKCSGDSHVAGIIPRRPCVPVSCTATPNYDMSFSVNDAGYSVDMSDSSASKCQTEDRLCVGNRLFLPNGRCLSADLDCPRYPRLPDEFVPRCESDEGANYCEYQNRNTSLLRDQAVDILSDLLNPAEDHRQFSWSSRYPTILLLTTADPQKMGDPLTQAIWGYAARSDETSIAWEGGVPIKDGVWQQGGSLRDPRGVKENLYLFIQAYSGGTRVGSSVVGPFLLTKQQFLPEGASCQAGGGEDPCHNPYYPSICYERVCRRMCSSKRDCRNGLICCGLEPGGYRVCR